MQKRRAKTENVKKQIIIPEFGNGRSVVHRDVHPAHGDRLRRRLAPERPLVQDRPIPDQRDHLHVRLHACPPLSRQISCTYKNIRL